MEGHLTIYYTVFEFYKDRRRVAQKAFAEMTYHWLNDLVAWSVENHTRFWIERDVKSFHHLVCTYLGKCL